MKRQEKVKKGKIFQPNGKNGTILRSGNSTYGYSLMCLWAKTRRYKMRKRRKNVCMFKALSVFAH